MSARAFDVVVIGAGPAGLAAARVVAEAGLTCVAIDRMGPGGQLMNLGELHGVAGLPGVEPGAMGPDLVGLLTEQAMTSGAEIAIDEVQRVVAQAGAAGFLVEALEEQLSATAVIIASGLTPGTTGVADEARYEGHGLSHCAHCDAPLFAGKPVLVTGNDAWAVEEAIELAAHASAVTLVAEGPVMAAPERLAILRGLANVSLIDGRVTALAGAEALASATVVTKAGERAIAAAGLFPLTNREPAHGFLDPTLGAAAGGLFRAGDVREGAAATIAEAIADGTRAGHNAAEWVEAHRTQ